MVLIDGLPLALPAGGTKSFTSSLLKELETVRGDDSYEIIVPLIPDTFDTFDYTLCRKMEPELRKNGITLTYAPLPPWMVALLNTFVSKGMHRYLVYVWERYTLPGYVAGRKPTAVFHPYQVVTDYRTDARKVAVIHDIFHWQYQERYSAIEKYIYDSFKKGCETCDAVITISETSRTQIESVIPGLHPKIRVCYEGIDQRYHSFRHQPGQMASFKEKYRLPDDYILVFNSPREYKNTMGALKVFRRIHEKNAGVSLVLFSQPEQPDGALAQYAKAHGLRDRIIYIPTIDGFDELCYLYAGSQLFLFLSYAEGFGLPPLEALACGTLPVVSNRSSLGELFAGSLPSFDPDRHDEVASFCLETLASPAGKKQYAGARDLLLHRYMWKNILPLYLQVIHDRL